MGSKMSMPVDESVYSAAVDSGFMYKYDATAQQYSNNCKTTSSGNYWRIGVMLDDGQTAISPNGLCRGPAGIRR